MPHTVGANGPGAENPARSANPTEEGDTRIRNRITGILCDRSVNCGLRLKRESQPCRIQRPTRDNGRREAIVIFEVSCDKPSMRCAQLKAAVREVREQKP